MPSPRADAFAFIDAVREQPLHLRIEPGPRHLTLVRDLAEEGDATGDLVPDTVIAAIAAEHSARVVSFDRNLARFPSVEHLRPGT